MKVLENQTLYQCDYCDKRLLTKYGAMLHEQEYCYKSPNLVDKGYEILQTCEHNWVLRYSLIAGEDYAQEPSHDECSKCGAESHLIKDLFKNELLPKEKISERHLISIARMDKERKRFELEY